MKRFPFGGWTSKLPPPDAALWQALEVECKHTLSEDERVEIERACHAYKMAVIERTQNGDAESVKAWLGEVSKRAVKLSEVLEERAPKGRRDKKRGREQAIDRIDELIKHNWPPFADARTMILRLMYVLMWECERGKQSLLHLPQPDQSALAALLDRLGNVYERISGDKPGYSKELEPRASQRPCGPFVRFVELIVEKLLPPEVKHSAVGIYGVGDPAYAVKNWRDRKRDRKRQLSLT